MVVAGVLCHAMSKLWQSSPKKLQKIDRVSYQTDLQILVMTSHFSDSFAHVVLAGLDLHTKMKLHVNKPSGRCQVSWALLCVLTIVTINRYWIVVGANP